VAATVKCRRISSVGKSVGSFYNTDRMNPSVKSLVIVFLKFVFKKLFRIYNIKLYKLIVIQTNYANKIYIKRKKTKTKLNNIHYKLNMFQKKYEMKF
jgi:hypothetical protein